MALHYVDKGNLDAFQAMVVENENREEGGNGIGTGRKAHYLEKFEL